MKQTQLSYPTLAHAHSSTLQTTASFQTTFNGLATAAARLYTLRDGELVLYKRTHSSVWQCRYKLFANEWHRQSTKRTALADAMRVAGELYDEARFRERMGLAPARKPLCLETVTDANHMPLMACLVVCYDIANC